MRALLKAFDASRAPRGGHAAIEVTERGPSLAARLMALAATVTVKPIASICSFGPSFPWPYGFIDAAAGAMATPSSAIRATIELPHCDAQLVRAAGVLPADGTGRVLLYMHGGAFLTCGVNTHGKVATILSHEADSPVLVVNYRMIPKHSVAMAVDDCYDAYRSLRGQGYEPDQIVLGGDSAGGYLALTLAQHLHREGEHPAAVVAMSPLLELATEPKLAQPNSKTDAMLPPRALRFLAGLVQAAADRHTVDGRPAELYEPLAHVEPGLPPTLIHVSGSEVLLHDARLAGQLLSAAGVPVQIHVWPGQVHVFQLFAPAVPEGSRSLRQIGDYIRRATPLSAAGPVDTAV